MNTILILHGWGSSSKNWSRVKELLENQGYKVFVPDLPGFGENSAPEKPWSVDDYTEWTRRYCDKNNLPHFFLIGHSFGGGIAVKFSCAYPEMVSKLILVSPALRRRQTVKQIIFLFLTKLGKFVFTITGLILLWPLEEKIKKILYKLAGTTDYHKLDINGMLMMKETFKKITKEDLTHCLSKIKSPTLIVWGAQDVMTPIREAYIAKKEINNARLEIIEDGEHGLNLQKPEILAEKIIRFITN
ncbi:MAG: alpha/beta hydrolase [Candidatus Nealsonbacteria bacterium]|nr:alpha/beta hydrolase [Candidatus Nealsonbacteria bacterium]